MEGGFIKRPLKGLVSEVLSPVVGAFVYCDKHFSGHCGHIL